MTDQVPLYAERKVTSRVLDVLCDAAAECVRDLMREHGDNIDVTDWQHDKERGVVWATAVIPAWWWEVTALNTSLTERATAMVAKSTSVRAEGGGLNG